MFRPSEYALIRIEMTTFGKLARNAGFESEKEFHSLVASFDISTPERRAIFKKWQEENGTKEGLLKLDGAK